VQATDLHRPSPASRALDWMLCLKTKRILWRDWTVMHNGQLYQVQTNIRATHVLVEERVKETMRTTPQDRTLASHVIASRPVRARNLQRPAVRSSRRRSIRGASACCRTAHDTRRQA